jgi:cysteinyl-tRNA synthetase
MGKSYNNVITLSELFSGEHPLLEKAYSPMTIRFFIFQTHYRSTLDFSNEALLAAEKGLKRLWEAYENLEKLSASLSQTQRSSQSTVNQELDNKVKTLVNEFDDFMNDDFNTAKVLANMFDLAHIINSMKDKTIMVTDLSEETFNNLRKKFQIYLRDVFGFKNEWGADNNKLQGVIQLLIEIRKDARLRKDFATSDKIRDQLHQLGISLKDEKDGNISWSVD